MKHWSMATIISAGFIIITLNARRLGSHGDDDRAPAYAGRTFSTSADNRRDGIAGEIHVQETEEADP